eukprot:CAMPEP_0195521680 /NCGR_PEP_ID=MMETSP0794_2-20130614/19169_1 /TAXON_ID=515487 /ORGANISM="Stephanopyxis turris, Strain CCMP 815" /LENGTH=100 /DNA_ID=CAMNT_0040651289 /DNA_START=89 /DNA_END=391 /DNA_ORIENTATION=+
MTVRIGQHFTIMLFSAFLASALANLRGKLNEDNVGRRKLMPPAPWFPQDEMPEPPKFCGTSLKNNERSVVYDCSSEACDSDENCQAGETCLTAENCGLFY